MLNGFKTRTAPCSGDKLTAVVERPTVLITWSPAREAGLDREPENALVVELDPEHYHLIEHVNAVVYATGYWKITEWFCFSGGEGPVIAGGRESDSAEAVRRVEKLLYHLWRIR